MLKPAKSIGSVAGGDDELDPRRLVIKGSGSTYVAGGKIEGLLRPMLKALALYGVADSTALDRNIAARLFPGLPRVCSFPELFLAAARMANVFNNFAGGVFLWRPSDVMATVLAVRKDLDETAFAALVLEPGLDVDDLVVLRPATVGEFKLLLSRVIEVAGHYEPFMEKSFELWRSKK